MPKRKRTRTGPPPTNYGEAAKTYGIQLKALMMMQDIGVLPARYSPMATHILEDFIWPIWGVHDLIRAQTADLSWEKKVKLFIMPFGLNEYEKYAWKRYLKHYTEGSEGGKLKLDRVVYEIGLYHRIFPPADAAGKRRFYNDIKKIRKRVQMHLKRNGGELVAVARVA